MSRAEAVGTGQDSTEGREESEGDSFSDAYDLVYEDVSRVAQESDEEKIERYSSLIPCDRECWILDLGCAEGKLAVRLAKSGHHVVASDISEGFLKQARSLAEHEKVSIDIIQCDIEEGVESFGSRRFDYIFMMNVIEHLRSPIRGLENARKLMKSESILYINTPNACSVENFLANLLNRRKMIHPTPQYAPDLHLQVYDYLSLQRLCHFAGLDIVTIIPTTVVMPKMFKSRWLAKLFPEVGAYLLVGCRKCTRLCPGDVIEVWVSRLSLMHDRDQ